MGFIAWSLAIVAFLTLLWTFSDAGKCLIKWVLFITISIGVATLPIPIMLLRPRDPKNALIPAAALRACSTFLGLTLSVEGVENIVQNTGCVVLINHQSMLDLIVLACLWPIMDNCTVISKKEVFYVQPFGLASWLWGTIFIERGSKNALDAVNKTGEIIRQRKARVLMFPEGTRNLGKNKLLPLKKGAFHLALASKVPIQPVAVCRYKFLKNLRFESGTLKIKILPIIPTEGCTKDDIPKLMEDTYRVLSENVDALSDSGVKENGYSNGTEKNGHFKTVQISN
ncbi:1-acyl-sn-glycerol-3-phosphate acyltransferase alpha isoform X2 [Dendroctonus ponderosae]|uniref:1-acyl-sn-glycerol-3-phosphate acyltransferase n=2 Tax=Dendroctonus ponderosae TaxID=77166 RepID=J3JWW5_DENPD|nr:1-acyl-sn-glycerol-3-phosphate acyltransferase alpha isoform X2 [Dendroctonus ponderosae]XP_048517075.1 1-acyl-sn-glycerol-3-phosphate acyltransferase alpha isoform X2 [Dendroctonus ponderosae]XP_048517076.1 1-acyl-sn-glycerol-3-phosphate acyltransferase alpha isoform X2 [Dendroctonus ponderosae]XP_048517077.1 1-acyl-sn-glycerol-3-phosphate acyltransferase alpha isoform X2 [Dendroctonus ponderosae]XP_048517078.1 1-acyl-sn-glycerol-3-phosphate acyltransferase alpha isoform X2 [Dendroctonus po